MMNDERVEELNGMKRKTKVRQDSILIATYLNKLVEKQEIANKTVDQISTERGQFFLCLSTFDLIHVDSIAIAQELILTLIAVCQQRSNHIYGIVRIPSNHWLVAITHKLRFTIELYESFRRDVVFIG
jgi:hypothetical protein